MIEKQLEQFFQDHPKVFLDLIFRWYNINNKDFDKIWQTLPSQVWQLLSQNPNFSFDSTFLSYHKEKVDWNLISQQKGTGWTITFLSQFKEVLNWNSISGNTTIFWDKEKIELFSDKINISFLTSNTFFPWSVSTIEKFRHCLDFSWTNISSNHGAFWTQELLMTYADYWNWRTLSENPSLPWSQLLIEAYIKKWDWVALSRNPKVPWTEEMILNYHNKIHWFQASENISFPWSIKLIEECISNSQTDLNWRILGSNSNIQWTDTLVEKLPIIERKKKKIWLGVGSTQNFTWTEEFIKKLYYRAPLIRFKEERSEHFFTLSQSRSLNWTLDLLRKFQNFWAWDLICRNQFIPWDYEIVKYVLTQDNLFHSNAISENPSLPWSLELLDEFEYYWSWETLINCKEVWEKAFKNYLSNEFVSLCLHNFKIDEYNTWTYVHSFGENPKYFKLNTEFNFGKYKGQTIEKIYSSDPSYIEFCLRKVDFFIIEETELNQLLCTNKNYTISKETITHLRKKITYFENLAKEEEYNNELEDRVKFYKESDDREWGDSD